MYQVIAHISKSELPFHTREGHDRNDCMPYAVCSSETRTVSDVIVLLDLFSVRQAEKLPKLM